MEQVFDFLARFGDIVGGIFWVIVMLIICLMAFIEVIDFLIVDPLKRAAAKPTETEES